MSGSGLETLSEDEGGDRRLVLRADPPTLARGPGWRDWAFVRPREVSAYGVWTLLAIALLLTLYPTMVDRVILLGMSLMFLSAHLERRGLQHSGRVIGEARWDGQCLSLRTPSGVRRIERAELSAVVWEPIHWHGRFSRMPLALGGQVGVRRDDGELVVLARGVDNPALRAIAERLSAGLDLPMVERPDPAVRAGQPGVVRMPEQLDQPLIERLGVLQRQWRQMPSYSDWAVKRVPGGLAIAIGGEDWRPKALAAITEESGGALLTLLVLDLLRLPIYLWCCLVGGGLAAASLPSLFDPVGLLAHAIACVPVVRELYRAHRRRMLVISEGVLTYGVGRQLVARIPIETIEEVRLEVFPRHAVRVIADQQQLVITELPNQVDYEALVDQLPHLLPSGQLRSADVE